MTLVGLFAVSIGVLVVAQWVWFLVRGQVTELKTEPVRITFHLAGELLTSVTLIVGGAGILIEACWGENVGLLALGMLLYTVVVSPGYFAQKAEWPIVIMFAGLAVLTGVSIAWILINN